MPKPKLKLKNFTFEELFTPAGLQRLDSTFLTALQQQHPQLHKALLAYRHQAQAMTQLQVSELLLAVAPLVEDFIVELFGIIKAAKAAKQATLNQNPIFTFKKTFVLKYARRRLGKAEELPVFAELDVWLEKQLRKHNLLQADKELSVALLAQMLLNDNEKYATEIETLTQWCIQVLTDPIGQLAVKGWVSFHFPQKLDYQHLVPLVPVPDDASGRLQGPVAKQRRRDGFTLTDQRMNPRQVLDEIHYCVYCHKTEGDFCSKGFPVKKGKPELGLKRNPLEEVLTGCPLEEKISEMHVLKQQGMTIAALAMIMVDNPMCPATGHRICNDCMKGCIYQKQEPVNIPQTETGILTDVLQLPWGVEIYDLFTRWNPLRDKQFVVKSYNGLKVLIMGMGPAGFSLAHHLLMEGFAVVGTDGLKIEPLPKELLEAPICDFAAIKEELDSRVMTGFGGVAEYGITVRWDKNFLKLIYISLCRRAHFQVFGGVRFGGTITVEDVWNLGFDHMAIAVGAGLPRELPIPGSMAPGMRQANDFLMALQLTGAAKQSSLANLQVRLPAVIIGGGLTGVDTATEVQAYYITQVEKMLQRYEILTESLGEARVRQQFDAHNFTILNEFLTHGHAVREERQRAMAKGEQPDFNRLIRDWGGVTIAYRRSLPESPAYRRNHEEVVKALEEGIYYAEGLEPVAAKLDQHGHVQALVCRAKILDENGAWVVSDEEHILPARAIFVATGARPNIAYEFEHRGTFQRQGSEYLSYDLQQQQGDIEKLVAMSAEGHCKVADFGAFTSYEKYRHRVTFLGDTHPIFHGSVVKAIASAKRTYPKILQTMGSRTSAVGDEKEYQQFSQRMADAFQAKVVSVKRHTPSVVEVKVHAPMAVKNFRPGQFYRVQNYETLAPVVGKTRLQSEAMAMVGAGVDKEAGTLSFMVMEWGASSRLFATFKAAEPISVMGPTGVRTKIPRDQETVMIVGGRMGAAHIRSVGPALRAAGNRVLYIAGFQTADEVYCQQELEDAADKIVWVTAAGEPIAARRPQDLSATGEFMSVLTRYANGDIESNPEGLEIPLQKVNRVIIIGTRRLVRMLQQARKTVLKNYFKKNTKFIASIYGPMQCMLKGVCAQCLQWQIDPDTGKRTKAVFACSWQDQPLEMVDLDNLDDRLAQNHCQEILTNLWLDHLFAHSDIARV